MKQSIVYEKAFSFAIRIVNLYKYLISEKKEYIMSKQLMRSGTSIGANISEALHGQSKKDFISKMNISLKEANESKYWLDLLHATDYINKEQYDSISLDLTEILKLLIRIIKTSKESINN